MPNCRLLIAVVAVAAITAPADARVMRIIVESREPAAAKPGAPDYEVVKGRFEGELDPRDHHNQIITDLALAPRNAAGNVAYSATFAIARPVDPARASGVLVYDVPNRGLAGISADPDGHVRVISGWQGDIIPRAGLQTANVPVAMQRNGRPITGPIVTRFQIIPANTRSTAITAGLQASPTVRPLPVSLDTSKAKLWRELRGSSPVDISAADISPTDWAFADCSKVPFPGTPDPRQLCLKDGFDPEAAYTLVYEGKDPLVLGIGFAATRDLVAFLRSGKEDEAGQANPAGAPIRWTVGIGTSQSGNFLRSFIHLGFNQSEAGGQVFDGVNSNIAARQVPLDLRFGVPGGAAGTFEPGSEGTLWWGPYNDRLRGLGTTSLLDRCNATGTCPKVVETLGSAEFWGLRASPNFVGTDAKADIPLPANVRRYYWPSVTHNGSMRGGFNLRGETTYGGCAMPGNPIPTSASLRVAQRALIAWVKDGAEPPPSRYPSLANGDLVPPTAAAMGWPGKPGAPKPDGHINAFVAQDFGPAFRPRDVRGAMTHVPPRVSRIFASLVPRVDGDGNEISGVPSVQLLVPLGTYTGWNEAARGYAKGGGCGFEGGFIPFARTRTERLQNGDTRLSLEERYGSHAGFVEKVRAAVAKQQAGGWLLADDAAALISQAEASDVLK